MSEYINDLLARMSDRTYSEHKIKGGYGLTEIKHTISSEAIEEARNLSNSQLGAGLFVMVEQATDNEIKDNLYFILGSIATNTKDENITRFLISRLSVEKDKTILVTILSPRGELYKPATIDLSPIIKCAGGKNWHVRGKAYEALTNSEIDAEGFLGGKLKLMQNNDDIQYLLWAITYVATSKSRAIIEKFLKSRQQAIKGAAENALVILLIREGYDFNEIARITRLSLTHVERLKEKITLFTRRPLAF